MMRRSPRPSGIGSYLWLILGSILLLVSNGIQLVIPVATWLAPVFLIRFLRTQPRGRGLLSFLPVFLIAWVVMVYGLYSGMPAFVAVITGVVFGLAFFLPYLADRLATPRFSGFLGTLVFPLAVVSVEYLLSLTPMNSWFALAYTQHNNLALIQLAAVTGMWGVSFLIAWFASVVNWAWQQGFSLPAIRRGLTIYLGILVAVMLLGSIYLNVVPAEVETVRAAGITRSFDMDVEAGKCAGDIPCLEALFERSLAEFLESSRAAAEAGAEIIVWQENGLAAYPEDAAGYIDRGREFAMQEQVHLLMGMYVLSEDRTADQNKAVLITPSGQVREYLKNHLTPGDRHILGDGEILVQESSYGTLAIIICQDTHTLNFVRQAGRTGVDFMLIPNQNWASITPYVAIMPLFRAIEHGFSILRADYHGLSNAVDYHGRVLAQMNGFTTDSRIMFADLPTQGVWTLYSQIGDVFAWLCALAFLMMIGLALARTRDRRPGRRASPGTGFPQPRAQ